MTKDMTRGDITKLLFSFAASILFTNLLNYVYSATDSAMVSRFVDMSALGSISAAIPIVYTIQGFLIAAISGFAIVAGNKFGAQDYALLPKIMANSFSIIMLVSIPISVLLAIFADPVLSMMNVSNTLYANARIYYVICALSMPLGLITTIFASMIRAGGDSRTPMIISVICGFLNVVYNYVFLAIIPLGVAGAAYGSIMSTFTGIVIYLVVYFKRMSYFRFSVSDLRIDKPLIKVMLSAAVPLGVLTSITHLGELILQRSINSFSDTVVTGISTGGKVLTIVWHILIALETAELYFNSQNYGAGELGRIKKCLKISLISMMISSAVCAVLLIFFGDGIYRIFLGSGTDAATMETLDYAYSYVVSQVIFFPFMATLCAYRAVLKGFDVGKTVVICGIIELFARIVVSLVEYVPIAEQIKIGVLFSAGPLAWIGTSIFLIIIVPGVYKKRSAELRDAQSL